MSGYVHCTICHKTLDITTRHGWSRKVMGWEEGRSGGGANKILNREVIPDSYAHTSCVRFNPRGDQEAMNI